MTTINVQFADASQEKIISYFGSPQDSDVYPNLGTVDTSDPRWAEYYNSLFIMAQIGLPAPT